VTVTEQLFTVDDPTAQGGLLAGRLLQSVQLLRVARHTGHVIPIAGGGLTVLSGRGPGGASNGAGKSSLAESVLLAGGDRQWTRGGAGAKAVGLLFSEKDAQQAAGSLGNAAYGYIAAVWLHEHNPHEAPVTVWMRLQREGRNRLQVRLAEGVQFAVGGSEAERLAHADRIWEQLRDAPTHGPDGYSEALFGAAPGSIGYVRNRGADHTPDTGLLAIVDGVRFRPTDLARELIDLCGLADQVTLEQQQRKTHADLTAQKDAEQKDADAQFQAEQQQLAQIEARATVRRLRQEAATIWRRYLAASVSYYTSEEARLTRRLTAYVNQLSTKRAERDRQQRIADGTDLRAAARRASEANGELDAAQKEYDNVNRQEVRLSDRLDALRRQVTQLAEAKSLAGTTTRAEAGTQLAAAAVRRDQLAGNQQRLSTELTEAGHQLAAARQGLAGQAGARVTELRKATVSAVALHDLIDLSEAQRDEWEPRLALLADAVVILEDDRTKAVNVLRRQEGAAGTALVTVNTAVDDLAPRRPGSAGVHPLDQLLTHLAARWRPADLAPPADTPPPMLVEDVESGISIVGGFDQPQTGRAARVRSAEERVSALTAQAAALGEALAAAQTARDDAQRLLDAVDKASQHTKLSADAEALAPQLVALREALSEAGQRLTGARQVWSDANGELSTLREQGERAAATARELTTEINRIDDERRADLDRLTALPTEAFRVAFAHHDDATPEGATPDEADAIAAGGPSRGRLRAQTAAKLRGAIDALPDLDLLDPDSTGQSALLELRAWCLDLPDGDDPVAFDTLAAPLDQWLTIRGNGDEAIREDIEHLRRTGPPAGCHGAADPTQPGPGTYRSGERQKDHPAGIP